MERWEKLKALSGIIAAIIIPIVILLVGNQYSEAVKERELQGRFVELAVDILKAPPTKENRNIRAWATEVIDLYSGVRLSRTTKEDLIDKLQLQPPLIGVPNLIGMNLDAAREIIEASQLRLGKLREEKVPRFRSGTVIRQDPGPGRQVTKGFYVHLVVATK
jgi:hypothetical protein